MQDECLCLLTLQSRRRRFQLCISITQRPYRTLSEEGATANDCEPDALRDTCRRPLRLLAAGVLAPVGILLSPAVGALLMSLSTVIVAINAQLLRREEEHGSPG